MNALVTALHTLMELRGWVEKKSTELNETPEQKADREKLQSWASMVELSAAIAVVATATFFAMSVVYKAPILTILSLGALVVSLDTKTTAKNMHEQLAQITNWLIKEGTVEEKGNYLFLNLKCASRDTYFLKHVINYIEPYVLDMIQKGKITF